jgi:hypothetical protein
MRALAAIVLAAAVLAGVASAGPARRNPCAVVTASDAAKALGGGTGAGERQSMRRFDSCTYRRGKRTLTVKTRTISRAGYDRAVKTIPGTALMVPGLGEDAWVFFVQNGISLVLWQNGTELAVAVSGAGDSASTVARTAAEAAVGRL